MNIFLCGYMGSGKSSLAKQLSIVLKRPLIDLDEITENHCSLSVQSIFETKGEDYFRKIESELLQKLIKNNNDAIIALGGGTIVNEQNLTSIKQKGFLIYLAADPSTIITRLENDSFKRPLLAKYKSTEELLNFIQGHLEERIVNYQKAHLTLQTDAKSTETICNELVSSLNKQTNL